jgi:hypothetical protein
MPKLGQMLYLYRKRQLSLPYLHPLNDDLVKLHAWSTQWLVNFNPQKTETMTISRKLNKPHQRNLIMNNTIISTVTEHKHLGLQLSDDGNWNKHIDMITKKAFKEIQIYTGSENSST